MRRKTRRQQQEDYTGVAFAAAAVFGGVIVAIVQDALYSAPGVTQWTNWRLHPLSVFAGTMAFTGLLYLLQRMNNRPRPAEYAETYLPLVVLSGANVLLKLNAAWLAPVAVACIAWNVGRVRKDRARRSGVSSS